MKKNNGITIIALIITIIVLLILAGVSIAFLTGDNGILNKANNSREEYNYQAAVESLKIKLQEINIQNLSTKGNSSTLKDVYDALKDYSDVTIIAVKNQTASLAQGISWSDTINELIVLQDDYLNYALGIDTNLNIVNEQDISGIEYPITISYDSNGGTGTIANTNLNKRGYMATGNITNEYFTRTGYTLLGFSEDKNGTAVTYIRGNSYNFTKDTTLYAIWGALQYANYSATGSYQTYYATTNRVYQVECWGASGGRYPGGSWGAGQQTYGAYTSGYINSNQDLNVYVYVGKAGIFSTYTGNSSSVKYLAAGGWNGGGDNYASGYGTSGGGATDIRTVATSSATVWKELQSLSSRIMVASGAGASGGYGVGGNAGGLTGYQTSASSGYTAHGYSFQSGASQIATGTTLSISRPQTRTEYTYNSCFAGSFGVGGLGIGQWCSGAGGGGGWYGGVGSNNMGSGSGGSSYISGMAGCIGVSNNQGQANVSSYTNIQDSYSYTGYNFTNTVMIDGSGYTWTTTKGSTVTGMPTQAGSSAGTTMTGNQGDGYCKISIIAY